MDQNARYVQPWQDYSDNKELVLEALLPIKRLDILEAAFPEVILGHEIFHILQSLSEGNAGEFLPARKRMYNEIAATLASYCMNILIKGEIKLSDEYGWFYALRFKEYHPESPHETVLRLTDEYSLPRQRALGVNLDGYTLSHLYVMLKYRSREDVTQAKQDLLQECYAAQEDISTVEKNIADYFSNNPIDYSRFKRVERTEKK